MTSATTMLKAPRLRYATATVIQVKISNAIQMLVKVLTEVIGSDIRTLLQRAGG
jgi:hypothetical protein